MKVEHPLAIGILMLRAMTICSRSFKWGTNNRVHRYLLSPPLWTFSDNIVKTSTIYRFLSCLVSLVKHLLNITREVAEQSTYTLEQSIGIKIQDTCNIFLFAGEDQIHEEWSITEIWTMQKMTIFNARTWGSLL